MTILDDYGCGIVGAKHYISNSSFLSHSLSYACPEANLSQCLFKLQLSEGWTQSGTWLARLCYLASFPCVYPVIFQALPNHSKNWFHFICEHRAFRLKWDWALGHGLHRDRSETTERTCIELRCAPQLVTRWAEPGSSYTLSLVESLCLCCLVVLSWFDFFLLN